MEKKKNETQLALHVDGSNKSYMIDLKNKEITELNNERMHAEEPNFTIMFDRELEEVMKGKPLRVCGRVFICAINTEFSSKGMIVYEGEPATKEVLAKMFGLKSKDAKRKMVNELTEDEVIEKIGKNYHLNNKYHHMGRMVKKSSFAKLYHESNRFLSEKVSEEAMGLLAKIIPLVNYETGSVCENPKERETSKLIYLTREDLAERFEISNRGFDEKMLELTDTGAVLSFNVSRTMFYKVNPQFVSKMHYETAKVLSKIVNEQRNVVKQVADKRNNKLHRMEEWSGMSKVERKEVRLRRINDYLSHYPNATQKELSIILEISISYISNLYKNGDL